MSLAIPMMYFEGRPFTRAQALAAGWTDDRLRGLVGDGLARRIVRGVYADALAPDTPRLRAAAVCLVTPPDAVICRRSAAWLYGIDALALDEHAVLPYVDSVRPPTRRSTRVSASRGHSQTLHPGDVVVHHGLRVTSPLATAVHLARHLPRPFALSAVDAMLHARLVEKAALVDATGRYRGHPGIVQAREIAGIAEPSTESPGESWMRLRVADAGFPRPLVRPVVRCAGHERRLALGFARPGPDGWRVGLDYVGTLRPSGSDAAIRDQTRRADLLREGWTILPVSHGDVWGRSPGLERALGALLGVDPALPRRW